MSRFGYTDAFQSSRSTEDCAGAASEVLSSLGCTPSREPDGAVVGALGMGWVIRLIGGALSPARWFPIKLQVIVRDGGEHRELTVSVEENFGVGSLLGVEKKIRAHCDDVGRQLGGFLKSRLS